MSTVFAALLSWLLIYKYSLLAGAVFASGIVPLPVSELLLAAGAFASQGYFSLVISLLCATAANVAADIIVYYVARTYGPAALKLFKVEQSRAVTRVEGYIRNHAGSALFFTRFVGGLDLAGTILAGLARVSLSVFLLFDFLGNAVNIGALLFIGYFFGAYWQAISNYLGILGWLLLAAALVAFWASYRRYRRRHASSTRSGASS